MRGDHYWKPAHNLSVRLHVADLMNGNYVPFGGLVAQSRGARADRLDWGIAASQTDVIGSRWVNEARVQVARQAFRRCRSTPRARRSRCSASRRSAGRSCIPPIAGAGPCS